MKYIKLNDGNLIPQVGIGTFMIEGNKLTERICLNALKIGITHIDTAHSYQNERGVGIAIKKSGVPRDKIWITSKLWPSEYGEGITNEAINTMLKRLDIEYIDLLLLHQQFGDYLGAWKEMEKAVKDGRIKSIGLSNFESNRLEEILDNSNIKPSVLQAECHPYYSQHELKRRIEKYGIVLEGWYPLGHGDVALLNEKIFNELSQKYNKSNAQIILRWHIQEGNVIFPKSDNIQHMKDNIDIFDFELTKEEMKNIEKLNNGDRYFNMKLKEQEDNFSKLMPLD